MIAMRVSENWIFKTIKAVSLRAMKSHGNQTVRGNLTPFQLVLVIYMSVA